MSLDERKGLPLSYAFARSLEIIKKHGRSPGLSDVGFLPAQSLEQWIMTVNIIKWTYSCGDSSRFSRDSHFNSHPNSSGIETNVKGKCKTF